MLAIGIAVASIVIELVPIDSDTGQVAIAALVFIGLQLLITQRGFRFLRPMPRLLLAIGYISALNLIIGDVSSRPMAALYLPVVAMAAAYGFREALIVGAAALVTFVAPIVAVAVPPEAQIQRLGALIVATVVLCIGIRRTVAALETAVERARRDRTQERRRTRQMRGVEDVGRILAAGLTTRALDGIMDLLVDRFDYENVSIYLTAEDGSVHLGAQRGYDTVVDSFDGSSGVVGRVMRTRETAFVRDVTTDPDYRSAKDAVRSEISVPLLSGGDLLGVLNVEHPDIDGLDESDRSTLVLVAERLAGAIALGRDREALGRRAEVFQSLAAFSRTMNGSLDRRELNAVIVEAVAAMLTSDVVVLTIRDAAGEYRIAAMHGGDDRYVGVSIPLGEGLSGRAIVERQLVVEQHLDREHFPSTVQSAKTQDVMTTAAVPLLTEETVLGALSVARFDLGRPFNPLDLELLPIVAGHIALAIANADLHFQLADAAIRDSLTGLFNRRHLDASLERLFASRDRLDLGERRPVAAILFDLDHFGNFNKRHGHRTGDAVLRTFGMILESRFRTSDIVARYGGEEFLVILDGASLDQASKIADDVRRALEATPIPIDDGRTVHATVSAGCSAVGPEVNAVAALLQVADVGLQMAKRAGRNQVVAA
jgi:diguanylate cyclase (GGDEF)-like protein